MSRATRDPLIPAAKGGCLWVCFVSKPCMGGENEDAEAASARFYKQRGCPARTQIPHGRETIIIARPICRYVNLIGGKCSGSACSFSHCMARWTGQKDSNTKYPCYLLSRKGMYFTKEERVNSSEMVASPCMICEKERRRVEYKKFLI